MTIRISSGAVLGFLASLVFFCTSIAGAIGFGPLASHMIAHIVLMNAMAPLLVLIVRRSVGADIRVPFLEVGLLLPTVGQIGILWSVHTPFGMQIAMANPFANMTIQLLLFFAAFWFWWNVFNVPRAAFWRPAIALAMTGKFYCLLGAILVFSPRQLYTTHAHTPLGVGLPFSDGYALADQQLAGLLMLVACPLSYMLAGVTISARGLFAPDESRGRVLIG